MEFIYKPNKSFRYQFLFFANSSSSVFFMGHKGTIEAKYTTNKGMLPDELVEEMRNAFQRSEEFLKSWVNNILSKK